MLDLFKIPEFCYYTFRSLSIMSDLLIKNAVFNGDSVDALIIDSVFTKIGTVTDVPADIAVLDACGMILAPAF